jgi:alkylation response protein AidB-like acyl-CoA dehydrogenase
VSRQIGTTGEPVWTWDGDVPGNEWVAQAATVARCATMVGVAERAIRMTAEYLTGRQQFGRPLATFQAVQQRIADAYIDVQAMRVTALSAAWRLSQELPAAEEVAIAKFWAAEGGQRAVSAAQHLHGGVGVDLAYPLHRYTLWAKDIELTLGGAHEQLARIGAGLAAAYT